MKRSRFLTSDYYSVSMAITCMRFVTYQSHTMCPFRPPFVSDFFTYIPFDFGFVADARALNSTLNIEQWNNVEGSYSLLIVIRTLNVVYMQHTHDIFEDFHLVNICASFFIIIFSYFFAFSRHESFDLISRSHWEWYVQCTMDIVTVFQSPYMYIRKKVFAL